MFRILVVLLVGLLAVYISGCGADEDEIEEEVPVNFVAATPPGGDIAANGSITLIFDNAPTDVTSTVGNITTAGKTAMITGPFKPGDLDLTVAWAGGSVTLHFHVAGL